MPGLERRTHPAVWIVTVAATVATWAYVAAWTVPRAVSPGIADYWFFTGVAERLRAGERLYEDVWDNKDPLVFHSLALARTWGASGAWVLELAWVAIVALSLYAIARAYNVSRAGSVLTGFVAGPFITLGYFYFMGTTHLPGIALSLVAIALATRRYPALSGVALALLLFFKLLMLPAALVAVVLLLGAHRRQWLRLLVGFAIAFVVISTWLAFRGEFLGFLAAQLDNATYSQAPIVAADQDSLARKVLQHVAVLVNPHAAAAGIASIVGLAVLWRPCRDGGSLARLWTATAAIFVVSGLTLAVTGKWLPHVEIMTASSALIVVLGVAVLSARPTRLWLKVPGLVILVILLAGIPQPSTYSYVFTSATTEWEASTQVDDITAALSKLPPQSFAVVGLSVPRSSGLEDWTLSCRYYGQRPFHPQAVFDEMMGCLPETDVVVLTFDPNEQGDPAFPAYSQFLKDVETLMARHFTCATEGTFRVCQRNTAD